MNVLLIYKFGLYYVDIAKQDSQREGSPNSSMVGDTNSTSCLSKSLCTVPRVWEKCYTWVSYEFLRMGTGDV